MFTFRRNRRNPLLAFAALVLTAVLAVFSSAFSAQASTSVGYDFNTAGDLAAGFNGYVPSNTGVGQSNANGISGTGAIEIASGSQYAVFSSKASYSIGPVGSTYTFSSFIQSIGGNGYSGMGFTSFAQPAANNTTQAVTTPPFRPQDALGISVHGGGFYFHNGQTDFTGLWNGSSTDPAITVGVHPSNLDVIGNSSLAPDRWFKIVLVVTRDSLTTFDLHAEVWPANSDGTLRTNSAFVVMELNDQTNTALTSSASINTYINLSGDRVRYFDNYQVSLAGGSSVIQAGAPVVLTAAANDASNVVTVNGNVTGNGGASVTERGIVYSTTADPTTSDSKLVSGSGNGSYAATTPVLPNGTYYFRAYATNATGTSYGVNETLTLSAAVVASAQVPPPASSAATESLALTGIRQSTVWITSSLALGLLVLGGLAIRASRTRLRPYRTLTHSFLLADEPE